MFHQVKGRRLFCSAPPGSKRSRAVSKRVRGRSTSPSEPKTHARGGSYQGIASAMPQARLPNSPSAAESLRRLAYFTERRDAMVATISELVAIESPSQSQSAVERLS